MSVQMKSRPMFWLFIASLTVGLLVILSINIGKITTALTTPPLTDEQIDSLAKQIVAENRLFIEERKQIEADKFYVVLDSLFLRINLLEQTIHEQDSTITFMRAFELPRMQVPVVQSKEEEKKSELLAYPRFDPRKSTWNDTLDALIKHMNLMHH